MKRSSYHLTQAECDRLKKLCEIHDCKTAASIAGCHVTSVYKARDRNWQAGSPGKRRDPAPSDFNLLKDSMTIAALGEHYGRATSVIRRWVRETGGRNFKKPYVRHPRHVDPPADIAEVVAQKGVMGACRHYGMHPSLFYKLRKRAGVPIKSSKRHSNDNGPGWVERYVEQRRSA